MSTDVTFIFNHEALARALAPGGEFYRSAEKVAGRIRDRAKLLAPVRTGLLRESIHVKHGESTEKRCSLDIGTDVYYAAYQEAGTGPIYPRYTRALRWTGPDGMPVFATRTKGVPARHYLRDAIEALNPSDIP